MGERASGPQRWVRQRRESIGLRGQLLRALPDAGVGPLAAYAGAWVMAIVVPLAVPLATGGLIERVPEAVGAGFGSAAGDALAVALVVLGGIFVLQRLVEPAVSLTSEQVAGRIDEAVQRRLMSAMSTAPTIDHLEDDSMRARLSVASGPSGRVVVSVPQLAARYVGAVGGAAIIGRTAPLVAVLVFVLFLRERFHWRAKFLLMASAGGQTALAMVRANYFVDLLLRPFAAKETRVFGLGPWKVGQYESVWEAAQQPRWAWFDDYLRSFWVAFPLRFVAYAVPYVLLADAAASGRIGLGAFVASVQATMYVLGLSAIAYEDLALAGEAHAYPAAREVLDAQPKKAAFGTQSAPELREAIRFEGVSFSYAGRSDAVLDGLDLVIEVGKTTAIVGLNGAGKTTLVKLLARLYEPTAGRITIDGVDLAAIDPQSWWRRLAVLFQDFAHYQTTASDNVTFGAPPHLDDHTGREAAARRAGAAAVVDALPQGWDTMLSKEFTGGTDLSGGQWQRIALARALFAVHHGARLTVLDEPTANLDVRAEADVFRTLVGAVRGTTTVLISHRFSTVRAADTICVLDAGRITERGTHAELLALDRDYARMFRLQADRFRVEEAGTS